MRTSMLVGLLVMLVSLGCTSNANEPVKPRNEPAAIAGQPKLRIELRTKTPRIKAGDLASFSADLINDDKIPVTIVLPGDGSESGWRTPIVRWNPSPVGAGPRCGNINPLRPKEVVTLAPGKRVPLNEWIGGPSIGAAGKYKVSLELENDPELKWA